MRTNQKATFSFQMDIVPEEDNKETTMEGAITAMRNAIETGYMFNVPISISVTSGAGKRKHWQTVQLEAVKELQALNPGVKRNVDWYESTGIEQSHISKLFSCNIPFTVTSISRLRKAAQENKIVCTDELLKKLESML